MFGRKHAAHAQELENLLEIMGYKGDNLSAALLECQNFRNRLAQPYTGMLSIRADIEQADVEATRERILALSNPEIALDYFTSRHK